MESYVLDTNVVAYYLLGHPAHRETLSRLFARDYHMIAPVRLEAELLNVLWLAVRNGKIEFDEASIKREYARNLVDETIPIEPLGFPSLALSVSTDHPVYDTLFVAAAAYTDTTLLTYDAGLRKKFPDRTADPTEILR